MSRKHLEMLVLTAVLIGAFGTCCVGSSLLSTVVINSGGQIFAGSPTNVIANSGSPADVQAAVDLVNAAGGGTVHIPAGTWNWDTFTKLAPNNCYATVLSYGGVNIVGAGVGQTIIKQTSDPASSNAAMLAVDGRNGKPLRISGISFQGHVTTESTQNIGISMLGATDYRIDHCSFDSFANQAINAENVGAGVNRGVIDHNAFDNSYKANPPPSGGWLWGYGIVVWDINNNAWTADINSLLGKYDGATDIAYIEDNTFNRMRHAVSCAQNGYYVFRHNTVTNEVPPNFGMADVHGFTGGRGCEVYNNTFIATTGYPAAEGVWLRGGTSTVFNNTFINCLTGVSLQPIECSYGHTGYVGNVWYDTVWDTYIWGNTVQGGGIAFRDDSSGAYTQNVDYFLNARPNYTPYQYPNPITLGP